MLDFINEPMDSKSMVGDAPTDVPPEQDEVADLVRCAVRAADGRKAENIVAFRVSSVSTLTTFVVVSSLDLFYQICQVDLSTQYLVRILNVLSNKQILSGNSRPQNQAIAAAIKADVKEEYDLLPGSTGVPEGNADSGWIVLDYGGVMVHVMTPKSRLYYNVEGQWQDKVRIIEQHQLSPLLASCSMPHSSIRAAK